MTPKSLEAIYRCVCNLEFPVTKPQVNVAMRYLGRDRELERIWGQMDVWEDSIADIRLQARTCTLKVNPTCRVRMVQSYVGSIYALNRALDIMGHMYYNDHNYPPERVEACVQLYWELFLAYKRLENYLADGEEAWR